MVFLQGPVGKRDKHVEKTQGYEMSRQRLETLQGLCRRFQVNASLSKLYFEFTSPKTRLRVLLNSSRFITIGVEKKRISGQLRGVRGVFAARGDPLDQGQTSLPGYPSILTEKKRKKNSIRGYNMVDESVIGYSADGKD